MFLTNTSLVPIFLTELTYGSVCTVDGQCMTGGSLCMLNNNNTNKCACTDNFYHDTADDSCKLSKRCVSNVLCRSHSGLLTNSMVVFLFFCLSECTSFSPHVLPSVCLLIGLSVCWSVRLSIWLSGCL
ncbi:hypothetical protein DPMN_165627 [Dreissena polymorpha]|uniref:EGF-like domain-containing protein n=1 Tax=Dreissena polymorpha TaxID=45954 RepID=A0A9D4IX63_DREPO|nr:hypothetical protein DPMN_165627 [Dreissena polymorpha]